MSLQFIMGPSGSGKSHYLYKKITEESIRNPEKNYIVLVPEQFTMQTQKELVMESPNKGIKNVDVLSFNRLAYRVFDETGNDKKIVLDDVGKNLIIRKVASDCESELKILGSNLKKIGYISEMKSMISEFTQYDVNDADLEKMQSCAGEKTNLYYKLADLRTIYNGFRDYIQDRYITGEETLEILCGLVPHSNWLKGSVVVLDEFTGFTPIQNKLLRVLLKVCDKVIVTVTIDDKEDPFIYTSPYQVFGLSKKMVASLMQIVKEDQISVEDPVYLYEKPIPRFRERGDLSFLESHVFRYSKARFVDKPESIQIWCGKTPREEVDFVAQKIREMVREQQWNYKDIAVITSDQDSYAHYIEHVFEQYKIPVFMDRKRSVLLNSFVEFLRSLLAMAEQNFSYESVFRYLRTGFSGLTTEEVDVLENYVVALGIRGYKKWQEKWIRKTRFMEEDDLERVEAIRTKFVAKIKTVIDALKLRKKTVRQVTEAIHEFFLQEEIQKQVKKYEEHFAEQGELALEKEYAQIYRIVIELFDQFVALLGEEYLSLKEYCELLDAGLEQAKVGIIPPSVDQVVVGDVERTRLKDVKAILFVGINDLYIPGNARNGGIISEYDREKFADGGIALAPTAKEKTFVQKFYLYRLLTKPEQKLILSYSKVSADGKSMRPAYLIQELLKLFPAMKVQNVEHSLERKEMTPESGVNAIVDGLQNKEKGLDGAWQQLFSWYKANPEWTARIQKIVEASIYENPRERLSKETAKKLYGDLLENSVTRLEKFSSCAYAHFLSYGLRLQEREEFQFQAVDMGNLFHGALEKFSNKLEKEECGWNTITEELKTKLIEDSVDECIIDYGNTILYSTARNEYVIKRLKRMLQRTVWAIAKQMEYSDFAPTGYEIKFGRLDHISTSNMKLEDLGTMSLYGKIDRVDLCEDEENVYVKVVDYKTGEKAFDLGELYHGLQMQLVLYLNAAMEREQNQHPDKKVIPAGLLYYRMKDPLVEKGSDVAKTILKELRPDGMVNNSKVVLDYLEKPESKACISIPVTYKNDGNPTQNSKVMSEEDFALILNYAKKHLAEAGTEILKGNIDISPFELGGNTGCNYCPYHVVCGFDGQLPGYQYRKLEKIDQDTALKSMRGEVDTWQ